MYDQKTKNIEEIRAVSMACNPFSGGNLLLVCEDHFVVSSESIILIHMLCFVNNFLHQIYDISFGKFHKTCSALCADKFLLTGGDFISDSMVVVWTQVL